MTDARGVAAAVQDAWCGGETLDGDRLNDLIAAAIERHGEAVRWMCAEACEEIKRTINEWDAMGDPAGEFQQWLKSKLCDEIANAIRALDLSEIGGGA